MHVLKKDQFGKILEQLKKISFNTLFARAVLELNVPGEVFAEDKDDPRTFLISHSYGMSLLFGDTGNLEFNADLAGYLLNANGQRCSPEWLQVYPPIWNEKIKEILGGNLIVYSKTAESYSQAETDRMIEKHKKDHVIEWNRVNFIYKNESTISSVPSKYTIQLIDGPNYDQINGSVIPQYFWKSKDAFLSDGVGYALIQNHEIASIAFSAFRCENVLEIGVETASKYRGMGFAKEVCQALLNHCHDNSYTPIWACRKENTGSYKLAKSLGFEESFILPYYELVK